MCVDLLSKQPTHTSIAIKEVPRRITVYLQVGEQK